ncbi:TorF family putative porin [Collimonas sp.]|uniref:TorF family putative porin n=1 Tax=Collimonas sp. TaxID=1963772 RepID=UPI002CFB11F9|nr:TorF family putative porin [Collimonas sp.]HWW08504.1 TorF family putative porin [Collimonas sp.]
MLQKFSKTAICTCCAAAFTLAYQVPALAQSADGGAAAAPVTATPAFSANATIASQYVSRGFRQTWGNPAIQGGVDYAQPSGLFAGTWMSSVSDHFIENGSVEWDLYGGYTGSAGDLTYTGQIYYYLYPGAEISSAKTRYNYGEAVASLTYKWFNVKYWLTYTPDYFGYNSATLGIGSGLHSRGSGYLDLNGTFDLGNGYSLLLHYGNERVRNFSAYSFQDGKVALSKAFDGGWTVTGAVTKGWGKNGVYDRYTTGVLNSAGVAAVSNPLATTVVLSLTKTF